MRAADEQEFREYVLGRQASLYRVALLLTGHPEQAKDLVQSALAKLALRWHRVRDIEYLDAYVRRTMYHEQVSRWRRRRALREYPTELLPDRPAPGDLADAAAVRFTLAEALRRLSPRQRAAVVLRYYADLPEVEVAEAMGCTVGTVRAHNARALARLRQLCPDLGHGPRRPEEAAL